MSVKDDLRRPINIIFLVLAVLGILFSGYFYRRARGERKPAYLIEKTHSRVFDSSISSPGIQVLDKDSKVVATDVYIATATFWNAGDVPIEPEDVRRAVTVRLFPIQQILDYSIVEQTHPDIANVRLREVENGRGDDSLAELELSWDHLDPGFGVRFQVMYAAQEAGEITISGHIVGVKQFVDARPPGERVRFLGTFLPAAVVLCCGMFVSFLFDELFKGRAPRWRRVSYYAIVLTLGAIVIIILNVRFGSLRPPV
jgi:hypothetical protein